MPQPRANSASVTLQQYASVLMTVAHADVPGLGCPMQLSLVWAADWGHVDVCSLCRACPIPCLDNVRKLVLVV